MKKYKETLPSIIFCIVLFLVFTNGIGSAKQTDFAESDVFYNRGAQQIEEGNYIEAISSLNESIRLNKLNANAHESLGWAYFSVTLFDKAKIHWQKAIKINPKSTSAILGNGYLHFMNEDFDSAVEIFKSIISQYPQYSTAYAALGRVYNKQGRVDEAIDELQMAIKLNPNEKTSYWVLGEIYESKGKFKMAEKYKNKAVERK